MSKHTKEPWGAFRNSAGDPDWWLMSKDEIGNTRILGGLGMEANVGRIVACVNACEGINPEAVPEMLEALKGLVSEFTPAGGMRLPSHSGALLGFSLATAAIAKAEK